MAHSCLNDIYCIKVLHLLFSMLVLLGVIDDVSSKGRVKLGAYA